MMSRPEDPLRCRHIQINGLAEKKRWKDQKEEQKRQKDVPDPALNADDIFHVHPVDTNKDESNAVRSNRDCIPTIA